MTIIKCSKCSKDVDTLELFPDNLCIQCYEVVYDNMSEAEKVPQFNANLLN